MGFSMAELGVPKTQKSEPKHVKVQSICRDPETGRTWSGRGKQPQSIVGKDHGQPLI
nr:H-NS family nucleoid-associated regulatory protein [Robbsia andropogonis]